MLLVGILKTDLRSNYLDSAQLESLVLEAADDRADKAAGHAVGLDSLSSSAFSGIELCEGVVVVV